MSSCFAEGAYQGYEVRLRVERNTVEPVKIERPWDVYRLLRPLADESAEHVYSVNLDGAHHLAGLYLVGKGSSAAAPADPKEVFKAALLLNCPSFLLVHNHPSGDATPSAQDRALTERIAAGARLLNLSFLDSIIITATEYHSMAGHDVFPRTTTVHSGWATRTP